MSAPQTLPDPLEFTTEALSRRGAIVEPGDHAALALLPSEVAKPLGLGEEVKLSATGEIGAVACGIGSPLLETLVADARQSSPVAFARVLAAPPKPSHARNMAERVPIRNGVGTVEDAHSTETLYVAAWFSYRAEADERSEGLALALTNARDGSVPDAPFAVQCDPLSSGYLEHLPHASTMGLDPSAWITRTGGAAVKTALAPITASGARRHLRDYERIAEYYAALVMEAQSPKRKVDAATIAAKVTHLIADRDAKLRDLTMRFSMKVSVRLAAALWLAAPAAEVRLHVKRRKSTRDIVLRLPAGAQTFDSIACEGCEGATLQPAFCDDRMHLLCETCVPVATGRPDCPACDRLETKAP